MQTTAVEAAATVAQAALLLPRYSPADQQVLFLRYGLSIWLKSLSICEKRPHRDFETSHKSSNYDIKIYPQHR
jgi:hypothetical protein